MLKKSAQLEAQIEELRTILEQFPEGNLICARNGSHYKWYQTDNSVKTYIPKSEKRIAENPFSAQVRKAGGMGEGTVSSKS